MIIRNRKYGCHQAVLTRCYVSEPLGLLPVTLSVTRHGTIKEVYQEVNNKKKNNRENKEMNKKDD